MGYSFAVMDDMIVSALYEVAYSALGAKYCNPDAVILGLICCGIEAHIQAAGLPGIIAFRCLTSLHLKGG
ncbi:hypothetical protein NSQ77_15335 [Oceanobacillus sp. FSL K6-2867]|uniref:hypothetical protein n=1 Tax=Oceanobacillus sp. FSL K6-2867 TaxID=2954748 RepID=UPI0030DDB110